MTADHGKSLFDFLPGRKVAAPDDPRSAPPAADGTDKDPALEARVLDAIRTVRDPEIPINLVDLGLIYELQVAATGSVHVSMTLTTPACPVAASMPGEVERVVRDVAGVTKVDVRLVWTPPWEQSMMTEEARLELGLW